MSADRPRHLPVMLAEVLAALAPAPGSRVIDATFGAGGYTGALLEAGASVIALDRDPTAIAAGRALEATAQGRLTLVETCFGDLDRHAAGPVDGVVLDIGVSSMQLDEAARGFSFRADGPLDMRMGDTGDTAADLVATLPEAEIADILYRYGEERRSRAVARAIVAERAKAPITRTKQLADLVSRVIFAKPHEIHPATRTFQALRIAVNDELGELERALAGAERVLRPGGRLVVVTFHSLEDRIVKQFFANRTRISAGGSRHLPAEDVPPPSFTQTERGAIEPTPSEIARNPRARSAKLRFGIRTDAPAHGEVR